MLSVSAALLPDHPAPRECHFWACILSSRSRNLYIRMTNNLKRRTAAHGQRLPGTHTGRSEYFRYVRSAIAREKQLKHWTRRKKTELIKRVNPTWEDLFPMLQKPSMPERPETDSLQE